MVECDNCHEWQHCQCMGFTNDTIPEEYFCERCKPELYPDLAKCVVESCFSLWLFSLNTLFSSPYRRHAKRARQSSAAIAPSRSSRSHSPSHLPKATKRRNTMNSRDAAYDESLQAIIEASAAEARAATMSPVVAAHKEETKSNHDGEAEPEADWGSGLNGRRKRKRSDDDA